MADSRPTFRLAAVLGFIAVLALRAWTRSGPSGADRPEDA
jgi:hypothetical protein